MPNSKDNKDSASTPNSKTAVIHTGELPDTLGKEYEINFKFRDSTSYQGRIKYSSTLPEMPFVIGDLCLYKLEDDTYKLLFKDSFEHTFTYDQSKMQSLKIVASKRKRLTTITLNGKKLISFKTFKTLQGNYRIGKGYKARIWNGELINLNVKGTTKPGKMETLIKIRNKHLNIGESKFNN